MDYKAARWILVLEGSDEDTLAAHEIANLLDGNDCHPAFFTSRERALAANWPRTQPRLLSDEELERVVMWRRNQRASHVAIDPTPESLNLVPMDIAFIHLEMSFD